MLNTVKLHVKNWLGFSLIWVVSRFPHRVYFTRSSAIPRSGPAILVVNHLSTTEALAVAKFVISHRRFPHFLAMEEMFTWPIIGWLARVTGQIPVKRGTSNAADALSAASEKLDKGQVVVLYPEGKLTREPDLRPGPAKTGAARLAMKHPDAVLIPVGLWGPKPGRRHIFHRHTAHLKAGSPIEMANFGDPAIRENAVAATNAIMGEITLLVEELRGEKFSIEV